MNESITPSEREGRVKLAGSTPGPDDLGGLPQEPAHRFTRPFARFLRIETAAGAILLLFAVFAVALSNLPWSASFLSIWESPAGIRLGTGEFSRSLKHWINDGSMTLFFIVALELKRELVLGELRNPRLAALSLAGALGGMVSRSWRSVPVC